MRLGIYRHYKNKLYNVLNSNVKFKDSKYVLYQCLDDKYHCWLREYNDFVTPGKFTFVDEFIGIPLLNEHHEVFSYDPKKEIKKSEIINSNFNSNTKFYTWATLLDDMYTCRVYCEDNSYFAIKEY